MHSAIIHLAENANIIQEETSTYPWTAFLSDTGGALGTLVLCLPCCNFQAFSLV